jgi:hypothetical protein
MGNTNAPATTVRSPCLDQVEIDDSGSGQYDDVDARGDPSRSYAVTHQTGSPEFEPDSASRARMPQAGNDGRYGTSYGESYFTDTPYRLRGPGVATRINSDSQNRDYDTGIDRTPLSANGATKGGRELTTHESGSGLRDTMGTSYNHPAAI